MYQQIITLYKVQEVDMNIENIRKKIELLKNDPQLKKMESYKVKFKDVWENTHSELIEIKKHLKTAEMDLVEIAQHLEDIELKIYDRKTSSKELEFMLKEKEIEIERGNELENKIINLLEEIDIKENLHVEQKNILRDINKKIIEIKQSIDSNVRAEMQKYEKLIDDKKKLMVSLSSKIIKEYESKRLKLKGQLVSLIIENQICGGCHLKISNNVFKKTYEQKVTRCEGCGRYLIIM